MSSFSLEGHVALVTGSSRGLGAGVVRSLASAGAKVVVNAFNNVASAQKVADQITDGGGTAIAVGADVSRAGDIKTLVAEVALKLGPIDIVVPNATGPQPQLPIEEYDEAFYQEMYEFFIKSPFLLAQATLPAMKEQKWGRIVNIVSEVFSNSVPNFSGYVAAKGGQIGWSRSMAKELAPFGITVNMVGPGWIPVERHEHDSQKDKDAYLAQIPAGRWGIPDDVGHAVRYFASEEAAFITGQTLYVNGGMTPW
jgi:3-oxoacyl-[acyl-carrier protein] reductase